MSRPRVFAWAAVLGIAAAAFAQAQTTNPLTNYFTHAPVISEPMTSSDVVGVVRDNVLYKIAGDRVSQLYVTPTQSPYNAKCDIRVFAGSASWAAGGTAFTPSNSITPALTDVGKKLVVLGAGSGGTSYAGTITGISGATWTVSPALTQASGLTQPYGVVVATAQSGGGSYAPGNTITLTGGTTTGGAQPILTVKYTKVVSATVAAAGSGGTTGTHTVTGTTGRGQYFQASVTIAGGIVTGVSSITVPGAYFTNPTTLATEPVTGAGLTGAQLSLKMGVAQAIPTSPGGWSVAPSNPVAQGSTSGSGTGATFTLVQSSVAANYGYGWWYYGTDDATALQSSLTWAGTNQGTVKLAPKQWCGTGTTLAMTDNFATLAGDGSGITEANRNFANTPYNSGLFWLGNGTDPIIEIATPDGASRIVGNSVQRMALICGNRAGYALRLKTALSGEFPDIYTQQCTNAALESTTNTNAGAPTDTQYAHFSGWYINQEASNGVGMRLTGDPSVGTGDSSILLFDNMHGWVGNDTGVELIYSDSNTFNNLSLFHPFFSGALYDFDLSGVTGFYTYGNRFNWSAGLMIVRGTDSSGTSDASTKNSYTLLGDPLAAPIEGPGSQLDWENAYLENNKTLTGTLITGINLGGGLYNNRNVLDGTTSSIGSSDISIYGGTARALYFNTTFDSSLGFKYISNGSAFALRNDNVSKLEILGTTAGTTGSLLSAFPILFAVDATTGTSVANGLQVTSSYPGRTQSLDLLQDMTLGSGAASFIGYNLYYDIINGFTYKANGYGFGLRTDPTGFLQLLTAPSGTAGAVASATQKVNWDVDGNMNTAGSTSLNSKIITSKTPPTIASGGCTTGAAQSVSLSNGTAAFAITLGGATCGSTITLTMPAASSGWVCDAHNNTSSATNVLDVVAAGTTSIVITNYVRTTGVAGNFTGTEVLLVKCTGL
jgi:hypothetical protein